MRHAMATICMRAVAAAARRLGPRPARAAVLLPVLLALLLGACGFHLQGREPLPRSLAVVRIDTTDTQSDFYFGLRAALEASGARIDEDAHDPGAAVIHILSDRTAERTLSVSTLNIPTEYELTYAIRIAVDAGGRQLIAPEDHSLLRDYSFNEAQLLAKQREREVLSDALARDLVSVVMRRLESL